MSKRCTLRFNALAPAAADLIREVATEAGMSTKTIMKVLSGAFSDAIESGERCMTTLRRALGERQLVTISRHIRGEMSREEAQRHLGI